MYLDTCAYCLIHFINFLIISINIPKEIHTNINTSFSTLCFKFSTTLPLWPTNWKQSMRKRIIYINLLLFVIFSPDWTDPIGPSVPNFLNYSIATSDLKNLINKSHFCMQEAWYECTVSYINYLDYNHF